MSKNKDYLNKYRKYRFYNLIITEYELLYGE